jgi:hypothetical protein
VSSRENGAAQRGSVPDGGGASGAAAGAPRLTVAEQWAAEPLRRFVDDARVLFVLLLRPNGQVVAQLGFSRAVDVMAASALAAGIRATSGELGKLLEGKPFEAMYHAGAARQLFLAEVPTARGPFVVLTVFDRASSLGLVRLYFQELRARLAAAAPPPTAEAAPPLAANFERELSHNLEVLFGRA